MNDYRFHVLSRASRRRLCVCLTCGATVTFESSDLHVAWHKKAESALPDAFANVLSAMQKGRR